MDRSDVSPLSATQIAGLGALVAFASTVVALVVVWAVRRRARNPQESASGPDGENPASRDEDSGTGVITTISRDNRTATMDVQSVQAPVVESAMSGEIPQHFSEDLIIPNITESGTDISREDETDRRSPEGV